MDLTRGACTLCSANIKVLAAKDAEEITKRLPYILPENFLQDLEKIEKQIQLCCICCYKIEVVAEKKKTFQTEFENNNGSCYFCNKTEHLIKNGTNWNFFSERCTSYYEDTHIPDLVCFDCVYFFDTVFQFKTKLMQKFPQLGSSSKQKGKRGEKDQGTKRKSFSHLPPAKRRKISFSCFVDLKALCNTRYQIPKLVKKDDKMFKSIAYVNLSTSQNIDVKETPKSRPIIKIKLKAKKDEEGFTTKNLHDQISKSEELTKKKSKQYSLVESTVNETPRSAISEVPKRRVSDFIDTRENETDETENVEKEDAVGASEEHKEVAVVAHEASFQEKLELSVDNVESTDENKNGISKFDEGEEENQQPPSDIEKVLNGSKVESDVPKPSEDEHSNESSSGCNSPISTPTKLTTQSESNALTDSDSYDKDEDQSVLNGSERKKKKVTFSDDLGDN